MASVQHDVLFFGSIATSVVGFDVTDRTVLNQLERQNAFLQVRATVAAPCVAVEEVFGSTATSAALPLRATTAAAAGGVSNGAPKSPTASSSGSTSTGKGGNAAGRTPTPTPATPSTTPTNSSAGSTNVVQPRPDQCALYVPVLFELAHDAVAEGLALSDEENEGNSSGEEDYSVDDAALRQRSTPLTAVVNLEVYVSCSGRRSSAVAVKRVLLHSLNHHATKDICSVVQVRVPAKQLNQSLSQERCAEDLWTSAGKSAQEATGKCVLTMLLLVRAVNLATEANTVLEADRAIRRLLEQPEPSPVTTLTMARHTKAPYGALPLAELYKHYRLWWSRCCGKVLKHSTEVQQILIGTPSQRAAELSFPHRWNAVTEVRLDRVLLGDDGIAPLLLTLAHSCNLRRLIADRNGLSDLTCARLLELFSRHRYLVMLSLAGNHIHEGGADQLLRLVRRNRRITQVVLTGNPCSDSIQQRIQRITSESKASIHRDPLNVFSSQYAYLTTPSALQRSTIRAALGVWAMLSAAPVGDVDVWVRNLTTTAMEAYVDESVEPRRAAAAEMANVAPALMPAVARAPLLNEIIRTVSVGLCVVVPDHLVRSVFSDMETTGKQLKVALSSTQTKADGTATAASSGSAKAGTQSLEEALPADVLALLRRSAGELAAGDGAEETPSTLLDELYCSSFVRIIVTTLRGISLGVPWEEVVAVLREVGRQEQAMGVMLEDYWLAVHIFMKALQASCGDEELTAERVSSFLLVLALGLRAAVGNAEL